MAKAMSFRQAVERLEEISQNLSANDVELEESVKLYEESVKLIKFCSDKLGKAEFKIKELNLKEQNSLGENND